MTYKLLIVDDEMPNLRLLERLFRSEFHCLTASSGADAIKLLEQHDVAILISDQRMPMMTGIELLKFTASLRPKMVRILLTGYADVEALAEALNCGLVYQYVTKPWSNEELKLIVNRACQHYESNRKNSTLALANERLQTQLKEVKHGVVTALSEMVRVRDDYAHSHGIRVGNYARVIGEKMGLSTEAKVEMSAAALLHDLGAIAITSDFRKTGCLAANQNAIVRAHSACEANLLAAIPELGTIADTIKSQHENFDGTGFPAGQRADEIPLLSRILRVADEYDSMVLPRTSASTTHDEAMRFLTQRSAKQFDPRVIEVLSQFSPEELGKQQPPITTYSEHSRLRQDTFEPAYVDAVL